MINGRHCDLVVPGVRIEKADDLTANRGVDDLVNPRKGKWVFCTSLVQACVIDAHSLFPILLLDQDGIGQPIQMLDLLDDSSVEEPGMLLLDGLVLLLIEAAEVLLN